MLFTVVTVSYNAKESIKKTIDSVVMQIFADYEYIVVDGDSIDGTKKILIDNNHHIDKLIIEPDDGIYDAMNKAIQVSKGKWIFFLNAGDTFYDENVLFELSKVLDYNFEFITGNVFYRFKNKTIATYPFQKISPFKISLAHHQGTIIRSDIMRNFKYCQSYKLRAETDFFLKAYLNGAQFLNTSINFTHYDPYGISSKISWQHFIEGFRIGYKKIPFYFICFPFYYLFTQIPKIFIRFFNLRINKIMHKGL